MRRYVSPALGIVLTAVVVAIMYRSAGPDVNPQRPPVTAAAASSNESPPPAPRATPAPVAPAAPPGGAVPSVRVAAESRDAAPAPAAPPAPAAAPTPIAPPAPRERASGFPQLIEQTAQENEQLGQIDAELAAALQRAADEAWRRRAIDAQMANEHAATLEALETLRQSKALLATGNFDGVDDALASAEEALSGRTRLDVEAAREALARSDLYPARQYLDAALAERRVPR